jgi:SprT protein
MTGADPETVESGSESGAAAELRETIAAATGTLVARAEDLYAIDLSATRLRFDLRGRAAGMAYYSPMQIRYNLGIARLDPQDFISATVPHEVAHLTAYGLYRSKVRPHGPEWQAICRDLGGDGQRCHQYDVPSARQMRRFPYACGCQTVYLSIIRVNRMRQRRVRYFCRRCHGLFRPADTAT